LVRFSSSLDETMDNFQFRVRSFLTLLQLLNNTEMLQDQHSKSACKKKKVAGLLLVFRCSAERKDEEEDGVFGFIWRERVCTKLKGK